MKKIILCCVLLCALLDVCLCQVAPVGDFSWNFPASPNQVQFVDQSANAPTQWMWNFGDGVGSTLQNPLHVFSSIGTYHVCLDCSNQFGSSSTICHDIIITSITTLALAVTLENDNTVCKGSSVVLNPTAYNGTPPYTFYWSSIGNTPSCVTCKNPTVTITQNSGYSVTVEDATGRTATADIQYSVSSDTNQLSLIVSNNPIDCTHPEDTVVVIVANGIEPYKFNFGDLSTVTGSSPQQHIFYIPGDLVINVTDSIGCAASYLGTVVSNGISILSTQTVHPICEGMNTGKIKIAVSNGVAPYTFHWSTNATADSIFNVRAGDYRVTVTDATLCSFAFTFNLSPLNGWGFGTYLISSDANCGNSGTILNHPGNGLSPYTYNWGGGITTQNRAGLSGGVYNVTVTDSLGCSTTASGSVLSTCYAHITGFVFNDYNNNCVKDSGELAIPNKLISAQSSFNTFYGNTSISGQFDIPVPVIGTYSVGVIQHSGLCGAYSFCGGAPMVQVSSLDTSYSVDSFALQGSYDFNLHLSAGWGAANPGFTKNYRIQYGDYSMFGSGGLITIIFKYDTNLIYQSSSLPLPIHDLVNHTLTWVLNDTIPFLQGMVDVTFLVPINLSLTYFLQTDFTITPTIGDCDSFNNHVHTSDLVTGSHDPNEKRVEPAGKILEEDSVLTYTIHFQNTGTDSTHFIIVKDTLSQNLNAATVRNIASSHPYSEFTISGNGILTWVFNPLRLVDSFTNEPGSHGFVKFTVKKKSNMPIGSIISNKAHIYFDYNVPVVTNTVADTVSEPNYISALRSEDGISVKAFPNPFSNATNILVEGLKGNFNFELYDVTGRLRNKISSIETNQFQLHRDELSSGVYFYRITSVNKKQSGYGKLVVE